MAYKVLGQEDTRRKDFLKPNSIDRGYAYQESIANGQTGLNLLIPPMTNQKNITLSVVAGGNSGKFQVSTSPDSQIKDGTATWSDWDKGNVTGTERDVAISAVTGVRGVSVSGAITIEVVI